MKYLFALILAFGDITALSLRAETPESSTTTARRRSTRLKQHEGNEGAASATSHESNNNDDGGAGGSRTQEESGVTASSSESERDVNDAREISTQDSKGKISTIPMCLQYCDLKTTDPALNKCNFLQRMFVNHEEFVFISAWPIILLATFFMQTTGGWGSTMWYAMFYNLCFFMVSFVLKKTCPCSIRFIKK